MEINMHVTLHPALEPTQRLGMAAGKTSCAWIFISRHIYIYILIHIHIYIYVLQMVYLCIATDSDALH